MKIGKKFFSLVLAVIMIVCAVPYVVVAESKKVIDYKYCDSCSFKWTLYDDYTLLFDGDVAKHIHNSEFFAGTESAKKIVIGDNLEITNVDFINYLHSYYYCEEFQVSANNPYYSVAEGVLFSKDKTVLYKYPLGNKRTKYTIPSTVEIVLGSAFAEKSKADAPNVYLEELVVPSSVIEFGSYACLSSSLKKVVFEDGERTLFIGDCSFYNAKNLDTIVLPSSRVYSLLSTSFMDTAYYNDYNNWDGGVLYLDNIILDVDPYLMVPEYSIKSGTKTIADLASFVYNYGAVKVTVPESLDNIGASSIFDYENFPTNVFRLGTIYPTEPSSLPTEGYVAMSHIVFDDMGTNYYQWEELFVESYEKLIRREEIPTEELSWFAYTKNSWLHHTRDNIISDNDITDELIFIEDGVKGIADETLHYSWFPSTAIAFSVLYYDGIILPESFENLTGRTILDDHNTKLFIDLESEYLELDGEKTITFLNPETKIFDNANTIWEGFIICGYKNSTAYDYAVKYGRKFVDISNCSHTETAEKFSIKATCKESGIEGSIYCQYCGVLLKKGGAIKTKEHNFSVQIDAEAPSCISKGFKKYKCADCTAETTVVIEYTDHIDNDNNGYCDWCGEDLKDDCSCNCHKDGIAGFFWKIANFFNKLFKIKSKQICACGIAHF